MPALVYKIAQILLHIWISELKTKDAALSHCDERSSSSCSVLFIFLKPLASAPHRNEVVDALHARVAELSQKLLRLD